MVDRIPMSQEGYDKLKAQLHKMENEEMPVIVQRLADARAEGDLKENAEYHGQREAQGMLQARIDELKGKLSRSQIVDTSKLPKDEIRFGARVKVFDTDLDMEEEFTLVGAGEEDFDKGFYPVNSPMGQALVGKKVGEVAEFQAPKGVISFKILEISYDE